MRGQGQSTGRGRVTKMVAKAESRLERWKSGAVDAKELLNHARQLREQ